jgi:nucleolar protein 12
MSLSSFLLGKHHSKGIQDIDGDLDALLRSSVRLLHFQPLNRLNSMSFVQISTPPTNTDTAITNTGAKRKRSALKDAVAVPVKRKKAANSKGHSSLRPPPTTTDLGSHPKAAKERKGNEVSKKAKQNKSQAESGDEEDDAGLEETYERKVHPRKQVAMGSTRNEEQPEPSGSSDSEGQTSQLTHETAVKKDRRGKTRSGRVHNPPPDETKEHRDARTIFLGNVPMEAAKGKVWLSSFLA